MGKLKFVNRNGSFEMTKPENYNYLYFPIAGEKGIKGSVTPNFGGDIKINQNAFLMEPVSSENLHNNRSGRNFWCEVKGKGVWSAVGASAEAEFTRFTDEQDDSILTAGFMCHTVKRSSEKYGIEAEVTSFVPMEHNVEIMRVVITNITDDNLEVTPVAAIPVFGRSADNIRDHRHVTSLLHRIRTVDNGVYVKPTLSFDERGHQRNNLTYFVCGVTGEGAKPAGFYPTVDTYIGEGGTFTAPRSVIENRECILPGASFEGKEAVGGIRFEDITLKTGESAEYIVIMGITDDESGISDIVAAYNESSKVSGAVKATEDYWQDKVNVSYDTGNEEFDGLMRWVSFQPFLRRIYGCSFLPHHDYGRGGRGWRDLWQDCLSLLIMEPGDVRRMILDNYGGVRIDGTNATIIGEGRGEFIADRNGIARVWMDHGVWPFMTTKLYIDQTGDTLILNETATYFKDEQKNRGTALDDMWNTNYGVRMRNASGDIYEGTILEHLLLQHLCSFYEVGSHNHIRLRGADWNDAIDMAADKGESVAFTCAYAGNMEQLADLLMELKNKHGIDTVELLKEIEPLLCDDRAVYDSIDDKHKVLADYMESCGHTVSGEKRAFDVEMLANNLKGKSEWIKSHIRETEWIEGKEDDGWFNSYYDNNERAVEGFFGDDVRMMLTGQVFAIMSDTAKKEQVAKICKSADKYLYKKEVGGYRLNTDFNELKFDMGRMFGFAYGEKENGAVFSHMTVMYANALYKRGFVKEGYKALQTLADHALDFEVSKIYPGIPEYFDADGRGLYHYLTGAGSWYMLTFVTEVFGVRGLLGDMLVAPKLMPQQFDDNGYARMKMNFADKCFEITIHNPSKLDYDSYSIKGASLNGNVSLDITDDGAVLRRDIIGGLGDDVNTIEITLG